MYQFAAIIDVLNTRIAGFVRWFVIAMALIQFLSVIGRYVFGVNSIAANEAVLYLHATLFMLGAGYTLLVDRHVRIDVFYSNFSIKTKRYVECSGHLFLLIPGMLALAWWSWSTVANAWAILEGPINIGGIRAVFLMKSLIIVFCVLLILQSIAILIRQVIEIKEK